MEPTATWQDGYIIHSYDSDFQKKAKITSICNYFQESAWRHAENLGWGFQGLMDENKMWFLVRLSIRINQFPVWSEEIKLETWPKGTEGIFALRDFQVVNKNNAIMVAGTSAWIIADINTRRPQRFDNFLIPIRTDKHAIEKVPEKISEIVNPEEKLTFKVLLSDLDMYFHVNNVKFIEWIIDSIPFESWKQKTIASFHINYLSEAKAGDAISIQHEERQEELVIRILATSQTGVPKETCRARILFNN